MPRPLPLLTLALGLLALTACAEEPLVEDSAPPTPEPGTLAVSFTIDEDILPQTAEPPVGLSLCGVFHGDDVEGLGAVEGAEQLESFHVEVDLTEGPTDVIWVTDPYEPGWYGVLRFLDSDDNRIEDDPSPDQKDPVTLPYDSLFEILPGEESPALVVFGLVAP